jgi:hypothetical protein
VSLRATSPGSLGALPGAAHAVPTAIISQPARRIASILPRR